MKISVSFGQTWQPRSYESLRVDVTVEDDVDVVDQESIESLITTAQEAVWSKALPLLEGSGRIEPIVFEGAGRNQREIMDHGACCIPTSFRRKLAVERGEELRGEYMNTLASLVDDDSEILY